MKHNSYLHLSLLCSSLPSLLLLNCFLLLMPFREAGSSWLPVLTYPEHGRALLRAGSEQALVHQGMSVWPAQRRGQGLRQSENGCGTVGQRKHLRFFYFQVLGNLCCQKLSLSYPVSNPQRHSDSELPL